MERHPRRWLVLAVLCLSTMVLVIDNFALNVAVPVLARDLNASAQDIQWILDAYVLVFAGLLLTAGSLSDRYGRRRVMIIGLVIFGGASLAAALAATPGQLIAGRVLMGVGGALVMPSMLSILITVFDDQERRKATSIWSMVSVVGLVGGPVMGGLLIDRFSWEAVFLLNVPVAAVAIVAGRAWMPESRGPWRRPDPLGAILSAVGMTALVWAIIELPVKGFSDPATLTALAVAVAGLAVFAAWQAHTPSPMVPLGLFRERNFSGGSLSLVLMEIALGGLLLTVTQYLQFVLGYSALETGLALVPMALGMIVASSMAATLGQKLGNRPLAAAGLTVVAGGFGVLATLSPGDGFAVVGTALALLGVGGGLAQPAAIAALMGAVATEHAGVGSALNDTIQQAGAALGVAVLGSVLASAFTGNMPASTPEAARHSIAQALGVAAATGDTGLAAAARDAFTTAMSATSLAGVGAVIAAAVVALLVLRDRKPATVEPSPVEPVTPGEEATVGPNTG
jgi:MFS transporter, DHA2 family, multidrug resistance protein